MLFGATGVIRSGKTTLLDTLAQITAEDDTQEVHCNFHCNNKKIKFMTVDDFMNLEMDEMNGLAVIQEFQVWAESRLSGSNETNRFISKTVLQSGKLGFDILWDAQLASSVDKRPRFMTLNWFLTRRKILSPHLILRYVYVNEVNRTIKFKFDNELMLKKYIFSDFNTRELTELKKNWLKAKIENKGKNPNDNQTESITPPMPPTDGDTLSKILTNTPESTINIEEELHKMKDKGITEIVS
jgi:hypothetical protein